MITKLPIPYKHRNILSARIAGVKRELEWQRGGHCCQGGGDASKIKREHRASQVHRHAGAIASQGNTTHLRKDSCKVTARRKKRV